MPTDVQKLARRVMNRYQEGSSYLPNFDHSLLFVREGSRQDPERHWLLWFGIRRPFLELAIGIGSGSN